MFPIVPRLPPARARGLLPILPQAQRDDDRTTEQEDLRRAAFRRCRLRPHRHVLRRRQYAEQQHPATISRDRRERKGWHRNPLQRWVTNSKGRQQQTMASQSTAKVGHYLQGRHRNPLQRWVTNSKGDIAIHCKGVSVRHVLRRRLLGWHRNPLQRWVTNSKSGIAIHRKGGSLTPRAASQSTAKMGHKLQGWHRNPLQRWVTNSKSGIAIHCKGRSLTPRVASQSTAKVGHSLQGWHRNPLQRWGTNSKGSITIHCKGGSLTPWVASQSTAKVGH